MTFPKRDLKYELKNKIGGFLGMGSTDAVSEIFFEKNEYYLGETAKVRIVCDNSKCDKPIKSFKFKLHRHYKGHDDSHWTTSGSKYLVTKKEGKCEAGGKVDQTFEIEIPRLDEYEQQAENKVHPDELPMLKSFSTSIKGKLLEVAYTLNCFIKHEAFTEFGEGNVVTLPIKLLQPPM